MTEEQKLKIDFAYYMAIANSPIYPEEIRKTALEEAITIGIQLGLPIPSKTQQNETETDPFDLSGPSFSR